MRPNDCNTTLLLQGAQDHIARLESHIHATENTSRQTQSAASRSQADLGHARTELTRARAEFEGTAAELRQQLDSERAEVLVLKEHQGASNKASDVIHALETQVSLDRKSLLLTQH